MQYPKLSTRKYLRVRSLLSVSDLCPPLGPVLEGSGQQIVMVIIVAALVLALALVKGAVDPQPHMYHSHTFTRRTPQFSSPCTRCQTVFAAAAAACMVTNQGLKFIEFLSMRPRRLKSPFGQQRERRHLIELCVVHLLSRWRRANVTRISHNVFWSFLVVRERESEQITFFVQPAEPWFLQGH